MSQSAVSLAPSAAAPKADSTETCICGAQETSALLSAPDRFHGRTTRYALRRCSRCSLVWLDSPPPPDRMSDHYGDDYDRAVAAAGDDPRRWEGRLKTISHYKKGGAVLDLGCSSGAFLNALGSEHWKLFGIEMSPLVSEVAERMTGGTIFTGDILDAPYPANSFDLITCFHLLEHTYNPLNVLRKVSEWLKPGGIFFTMVPNIDSAGARLFRSYWYALELPRHLYHFSPRSLSHIADLAGLEPASVSTHRELFFEKSVRYCIDELCRRAGRPRTPLAFSTQPTLSFRAVRKAFRLTVLPIINIGANLMGPGESIHAIYRKPAR